MKKPSSSAGQIISKAFSTNNALSRSLHWPSFPKWMRSWSFTTREVIGKAIMQLKVGKSPGIDGITAVVYQHGGGGGSSAREPPGSVHQLLGERDSTAGPQGCSHCLSAQKQGRNIRLFNYRGITLHSIAGRILARVLLNRLIPTTAQETRHKASVGSGPAEGP